MGGLRQRGEARCGVLLLLTSEWCSVLTICFSFFFLVIVIVVVAEFIACFLLARA